MVSRNITAYVMAGGASRRFGEDKALVELDGKPMLRRMIEVLEMVTKEVKVVAVGGTYQAFETKMVEDRWPGEGPLGGIITALEDAAADNPAPSWNLIASCDMPFLTREWLAFLVERAAGSDAQVILPNSRHGPEPLCACYHTKALVSLRAVFEGGVRKVTEALKHVQTEVLDQADWKRFDTAGRLFWNMNTPSDLAEARKILELERT
jgi:molybdenum cofactor guanylyltransferase